MPNNNLTKEKNNKHSEKEGIVYATIFVLYFGLIILMFTYSIKFLGETINEALSDPQGKINEESYGQLNLETYSLVSEKLNLVNPGESVVPPIEIINEATNSPEINTTKLEIVTTSETEFEEIRPTISIMNSTLRSGLASKLKQKLENAGFTVIKSGNTKPAKDVSVIYFKDTLSPNSKYLLEIQKIVSEDYTFVVFPLGNDYKSDIEIIIGNK